MARLRFISLEGGEGSGKSKHSAHLAEWLKQRGQEVLLTREPGGTPGAEEIRQLLVQGEVGRWEPMTEALLHVAARRDHVSKVIRPTLARGAWVVCDRFADSTLAYQGHGHGLGIETVALLHKLALGEIEPGLTLLFDVPVDLGLERAAKRRSLDARYENMGREFHRRVREGFLAIARREPERVVVIDSSRPFAEVAELVQQTVHERYPELSR
jgi:dTMP kinase